MARNSLVDGYIFAGGVRRSRNSASSTTDPNAMDWSFESPKMLLPPPRQDYTSYTLTISIAQRLTPAILPSTRCTDIAMEGYIRKVKLFPPSTDVRSGGASHTPEKTPLYVPHNLTFILSPGYELALGAPSTSNPATASTSPSDSASTAVRLQRPHSAQPRLSAQACVGEAGHQENPSYIEPEAPEAKAARICGTTSSVGGTIFKNSSLPASSVDTGYMTLSLPAGFSDGLILMNYFWP
ncbi:hypothetical protein EJ06DRAFT_62775 [Trichodelitschia bisporula]|uniref:Uncharacterized protein n=1 Tax=Trichodelitschia bisporula TaxID=703511 RepID=A0A6G1HV14_9PEZI|nr:hypothetical protein EJ06DRAFT_62775 [Trichodelitschia bisporula]